MTHFGLITLDNNNIPTIIAISIHIYLRLVHVESISITISWIANFDYLDLFWLIVFKPKFLECPDNFSIMQTLSAIEK